MGSDEMQHNFEEILGDLIEEFLERGHGDMAEVYFALNEMCLRYQALIEEAPQEQCTLKRESLWDRLKNLLKFR
jgi:hypothetical protein